MIEMGKVRMQKEEEGSGQTVVGMHGAMCKKVSRDVAKRGRTENIFYVFQRKSDEVKFFVFLGILFGGEF